MKRIRIVIAGIGGVGGYFGGLLAKHFYDDDEVEIIFIARGEHLKEIQKNGLKVIQGSGNFIAIPTIATGDPSKIGKVDYIIVSTKSYDLESVVEQLKPCIHKDTILLPLLNGVESKEVIEQLVPGNLVLDGCVYIVARLKQPGVVENSGNIQKLFFGPDHSSNEKVVLLEKIFKEAGIETTLSNTISTIMWEKFIFISPTATATSYFDKSIGEVLGDQERFTNLVALIEEVKLVARAKQISISENTTENTISRLKSLPFETTSSMHSDFKNKKQNTELKSLTGYVIAEGEKYKIATPTYLKMYASLEKKNGI